MLPASKLGQLIEKNWHADDAIAQKLREAELVRPDVSDSEIFATIQQARDEDDAEQSFMGMKFNSPHERVRVFLAPYLTPKGERWAVPIDLAQRAR